MFFQLDDEVDYSADVSTCRYILQAPNCWHLFNNPQYPHYGGRARFEEPEM